MCPGFECGAFFACTHKDEDKRLNPDIATYYQGRIAKGFTEKSEDVFAKYVASQVKAAGVGTQSWPSALGAFHIVPLMIGCTIPNVL